MRAHDAHNSMLARLSETELITKQRTDLCFALKIITFYNKKLYSLLLPYNASITIITNIYVYNLCLRLLL